MGRTLRDAVIDMLIEDKLEAIGKEIINKLQPVKVRLAEHIAGRETHPEKVEAYNSTTPKENYEKTKKDYADLVNLLYRSNVSLIRNREGIDSMDVDYIEKIFNEAGVGSLDSIIWDVIRPFSK